MKKIVIVAPTFNEEENIANFIEMVLLQQKKVKNFKLEILISDSHSKDKTREISENIGAKESKVHYIDSEIPGPGKLGMGLSAGLDYAIKKLNADALITMEADLSNDPDQIPDFASKLKKYDIVIGSRYVSGGKIVNWSWWRKLFSLCANSILRAILGFPKVHEFTNLYRGFTKEVWLELSPKMCNHSGWIFVPAFAFNAIESGFKIIEQPIIYYDRFGGRSKMKTLSYTKNLLQYALRYRLKKHGTLS